MLLELKVSISTGRNLHIRTGPSTAYRIVGKYKNGTTGIIVDQKKTLPNGQIWYRVKSTGYWIAQNNPADKAVPSYLVITKDLEKKTEHSKPKPSKPDPRPNKKPTNKNDNGSTMTGETIYTDPAPDNTTLQNSMKTWTDGDVVWHQEVTRTPSNN